MDSLTIAVPTEQQDAVASWQDGESYTVTIKQTGPGQFDLVSVEPESPAEDKTETGEGGPAMDENPAMDTVMKQKKGA